MGKSPSKRYPTIGVCGLDCGLCPRYHSEGSSRCPGCCGPDFFDKHPSCSFITCCVKKKNLEVCVECPQFPCSRIKDQKLEDSPSYPSYKKVIPNFNFVKENGVERFVDHQKERINILEILLEDYNDGRSKSFFCRAATLLELKALKTSLEVADQRIEKEKIDQKDVKCKSTILKACLTDAALEEGIELKIKA